MRSWLLSNKNIEKNSYIWNMAGSMLNAFQTVIMYMILARTVGNTQTSVFSIAYAHASLYLNLGNYGMRNFQVSDIKKKYSFNEYFVSRLISTAMMIAFALVHLFFIVRSNSYTNEKIWIMIWMILQKSVDAIENVYHGQYQQNNRLDVGGRCMTVRMILLYICFGTALIVTKDLLVSLVFSTVTTFLFFVILTAWTRHLATKPVEKEMPEGAAEPKRLIWQKVGALLWHCFPLCAGLFLSFYIGNAPKYAIDAIFPDLQARYNYISMPVFVVGMLNNFIFMPQMTSLSKLWQNRDMKKFTRKILMQVLILAGITAVCLAGAFLLGIPVLSFLYSTDLAEYKSALLILIIGGGFLGLTGFLNAVITIIRCQKFTMFGYAAVALAALLLSNKVVEKYEVNGASVLYLALMAVLSLIFVVMLVIGIQVKKNKPDLKTVSEDERAAAGDSNS